MASENPLRLVTPVLILSYPHITPGKPYTGPHGDQKPKYQAALIGTAETDLTPLQNAILLALKGMFGEKTEQLLRANALFTPFFPNERKDGYPPGGKYFNAKSSSPPGLVLRQKGDDGKPVEAPPEKFYPGCKVKALITAYAFNNVQKGATFGLDGLQFWDDGDRLDNRVNAQDAFEADLSEEPASLTDMQGALPQTPAATGGTDLAGLL